VSAGDEILAFGYKVWGVLGALVGIALIALVGWWVVAGILADARALLKWLWVLLKKLMNSRFGRGLARSVGPDVERALMRGWFWFVVLWVLILAGLAWFAAKNPAPAR
jgi:hypothetical protein